MSLDMGQLRSTIKDSPVPYSLIRFSCLLLPGNQVSASPLPVSLSLSSSGGPEVYRPLMCYQLCTMTKLAAAGRGKGKWAEGWSWTVAGTALRGFWARI